MFFSQQIFLNTIENEMNIVIDSVSNIILEKWREGGHPLTGSFEQNLRKEVQRLGNRIVGNIFLNDYYQAVNEGVPPENVPFTPNSGRATSEYIQGLILFFQLRAGLSIKDATGAAFGLAHKHIVSGIPLDKSRLGFFTNAMKDSEDVITEGVEEMFGDAMNAVIDVYQNKLNGKMVIYL